MITGMKKKDKITEIFFDVKFSNEYPDECKLVDDSGNGMLEFEINKGRFCFRLTAPYSEERKQMLSRNATQDNHLPKK